MLFNSGEFLVFFTLTLLIYFNLSKKHKNLFLSLASLFFYGWWKAEYLILILASTFINFMLAIKIEKASQKSKLYLLITSFIINIGNLFLFKYFNFFQENFIAILEQLSIQANPVSLKLILPVGISFYTFQTFSYTIDVYRGAQKAEKDIIDFSLYVNFFPQLVAGPIERSTHLIPQLKLKNGFDLAFFQSGILKILIGLFKKVVLADNLAEYVNLVYGDYLNASPISLLLASYAFSFQIYYDFSGYSEIAIGIARIFGIDLMKNFNHPYLAVSISDFWKRWHISLSTWFRDYLYIPLGGNKRSSYFTNRNILITFLVSGLWHGANWTFVVWGAFHAILLIIENLYLKKLANDQNKTLLQVNLLPRRIIIFHLIVIGWIFFRSESIEKATFIITKIFHFSEYNHISTLIFDSAHVLIFILLSFLFEARNLIGYFNKFESDFLNWKPLKQQLVFFVMAMIIILLGKFTANEFIYFQF